MEHLNDKMMRYNKAIEHRRGSAKMNDALAFE
jgi:hypothetical protein